MLCGASQKAIIVAKEYRTLARLLQPAFLLVMGRTFAESRDLILLNFWQTFMQILQTLKVARLDDRFFYFCRGKAF